MRTIKRNSFMLLTVVTFVLTSCNNSQNTDKMDASNNKEINQLFPKGEKINNDYFSGTAWLQMLVTDKENFDLTIGNVTFEPGVRNNWHSHPGGQILLCTKGQGYYQEKGKPIQLLNVGDVIEIHADIVHWHGATPNNEFEHLAISPQAHKGAVVWMEPVSEEEYNSYNE